MRVIGLDLSLAATGVAIIDDGAVEVHTIRSSAKADASIAERVKRLGHIRWEIDGILTAPTLVVIEGPSFGQSRQGGEHLRAGLWWLIASARPTITAEVPPATLKKYATGKGNAAKDAVLLATARRFPNVDLLDNNQADALWLAAMGARYLGQPVDDVPQLNQTAMAAVRWPS